MTLDLIRIRQQFPALAREEVFFDNPGGTQVARQCLDRISAYLVNSNANHGGLFATSVRSDAVLEEAHQAMADLYNAPSAEEIIFGANMTTLTLHLSRSISREWNAGDEIVVTRLDHDANVTPWILAAEDRGVKVNWVDFDVEDGTLSLDSLEKALQRKPKFLAVGYASNALGTINPVGEIIQMAHKAGATVFVDAVQYAAHGAIDVQELDCDYLVSSAYKYFGPHMGILYGKKEHLQRLYPYKVRPASNELPSKWETGTQNHEGIAGVLGAVEYFQWVGQQFGQEYEQALLTKGFSGRRLDLRKGLASIHAYEMELNQALLIALQSIPGLRLYGPIDPSKLDQRVATFAFRLEGISPQIVAEELGNRGINVWDGNYYAINATERLGVEESGGMVRVGAVHYNTMGEVEKLRQALLEISQTG
jgi:cysteine desulfurase family protein (TIGR01976 family)